MFNAWKRLEQSEPGWSLFPLVVMFIVSCVAVSYVRKMDRARREVL